MGEEARRGIPVPDAHLRAALGSHAESRWRARLSILVPGGPGRRGRARGLARGDEKEGASRCPMHTGVGMAGGCIKSPWRTQALCAGSGEIQEQEGGLGGLAGRGGGGVHLGTQYTQVGGTEEGHAAGTGSQHPMCLGGRGRVKLGVAGG